MTDRYLAGWNARGERALRVIAACTASFLVCAPAFAERVKIETVLTDLRFPWSVAFMADGGLLLGLKFDGLFIVLPGSRKAHRVEGSPADGIQGGAAPFDVAVDPREPTRVADCYTRRLGGDMVATVAIVGRLRGSVLGNVETVYQQRALPFDAMHLYGCRVAFRATSLLVAVGSRVRGVPDLGLGQVVSVDLQTKVVTRISSGHRNPQGLMVHGSTIYETEHGPAGGDELNVIEPGGYYGWPFVGHGTGYDGLPVMEAVRRAGVAEPLWYWAPSIAPSGLTYYDGKLFADWKDSILVGALVGHAVYRMDFLGNHLVGQEIIDIGARVRDVREAPDGAIYVLTDEEHGKLLRLTPDVRPHGTFY